MPDLKDELDALFGDEEKPKEEETEAKAEETAEDDTSKSAAVKKAKMPAIGSRTGAIAARKVPGKAAVPSASRTKPPEPEAESEAAPAHAPASRAVTSHAHDSGGGGGLIKALLAVSLVLNILVLIFAINLMGKMGSLQDQMLTVNKNIASSTMMSRAQVGVYTDRGGVDTAILFYLPTDVNKFPQEGKAYRIPLDKLLQNTGKE